MAISVSLRLILTATALGLLGLSAFAEDPGNPQPSLLDRLYPNRSGADLSIDLQSLRESPDAIFTPTPRPTPAATPSGTRLIIRRPAHSLDEALTMTRPLTVSEDLPTTARPLPAALALDAAATLHAAPSVPLSVSMPAVDLEALTRAERLGHAQEQPEVPSVNFRSTVPGPVRVNLAGHPELMDRLRLDARRARLIIEFRESHGRFHGPEDLNQVNGITDGMVRAWEEAGLLRFD